MNKGFTLIELLVVVLIIAILSSIALPQYQKAVDKARGTEVLTALNAFEKAQTIYYLENREFTSNMANLAIELPPMKHFTFYTSGALGMGSFEAVKGSANVHFIPSVSNGKPYFTRYCTGSDCKNYFNCQETTISVGCGSGSYTRCNL